MFNQKKYLEIFAISTISIIALFLLFAPLIVFANGNQSGTINPVPNPSAAYCEELGYEFIIKDTQEGQIGVCKISDSVEASAWDFLRGKEAVEYNYCSKKGYEMKITDDPEKCGTAFSRECAVCVLKDGSEAEPVNLMKIENENINICNLDGICSDQETAQNCPQDCAKAGKTISVKIIIFIVSVIVIILIITAAYYFLIKRKEKSGL